MDQKIEIELDLKTGASAKDIDKLNKSLNKVKDTTAKISKDTDSIASIGENAKKSQKGISGMFKGLSSVGNLFKASGVFFIAQKVMEGLQEAFMNNQKVVDSLAVASKTFNKIFSDFINLVIDNTEPVIKFFKAAFENPMESLKKLGEGIKNNLIERFESALDMLGFLGTAIKKVFQGDWDGAMEAAKMAGKEYVDVLTGVDGSVDKISNGVVELTSEIKDYTKEVYKNAKASVALNKQAEIAEALNAGLIEKYDIQAESLRQIRDDETKGVEARIEANNKLGVVLEKQSEEMGKNAKLALQAAQLNFKLNASQENKVALIQAENEVAAVNATVIGFQAEQKSNLNALNKEAIEIGRELALLGQDEFERQRTEAEQKLEQDMFIIEQEVTNEEEKLRLLAAANKDYQKTVTKIDEEESAKRIELEQAVTNAKIDLGKSALGALQGLAKEGSAASKAMAVGQVVLDAYKAISATFANAAANPTTILFPGYPFVQAAIAGVQAFGSVKKILSVNPMSASQGSAQAPPSRGLARTSTAQAPAFNVVGASPENQLANAIGKNDQKPIKAFVVSNDVTNAQSLDRNIVESASIG
tara:strand:+ start:490 stop:2256 length:1767 start_codon:yes stop_codon:yes gene_type:complete